MAEPKPSAPPTADVAINADTAGKADAAGKADVAANADTHAGRPVAIHLDNVSKSFNGFYAVKDLSLEIREGEFFAFLGPNGAGKTTTIKMLAGLLRPTEGRALLGGFDIQTHPTEAKRLIGHIPDTPYLYEKLSGREFFHFIGDLHEIDRDEQDRQRRRFFEMFSLEQAADRLIENYSHGMRQKLCFSVALMHNPRVLIVDEPMVGLDPRSSRIVKDLLKAECARGVTIFLSTHQLSVAEELCDRLGIITRGRLRFLGRMDELRDQTHQDGTLEDLFLELTADGVTEE